jgi:replicative superfamily II helicase
LGLNNLPLSKKRLLKNGLCKNASLVITAPTSTGKTMIGEIAVINGVLRGTKII